MQVFMVRVTVNCIHTMYQPVAQITIFYLLQYFIECMLLSSFIAGLDFEGSHFMATFAANNRTATVEIPIIADLNIDEGDEFFSVQLSLRSREISSNLPYIAHARLGRIPQAEIHILDEIVLNFQDGSRDVDEGANLTLYITASPVSVQDYNFTVNITGKDHDSQCKLLTAILRGNLCIMS